MNKYKKLLIPLLLLLVAGYGLFYVQNRPVLKEESTEKTDIEAKTILIIDGGAEVDATAYIDKSALEATRDLTNNNLTTTGSGINAYVTAINGRSADPKKNEYWEMLVNAKPSEVGAGSYILKKGDQIEWRISTY